MVKEQKKKRDKDSIVAILRYIANFIVKLLAKTGITPNQITILNFLIFTPLIVYYLIRGTYIDNLIALFFIFLRTIFDLVDGSLAKIKSLQSKFGACIDGNLDMILQYLIFCAVIIGVVNSTGDWQWLLPGLVLLFGQSMANVIGLRYELTFGLDSYMGSEEFNNKFSNLKKISLLDSFLKNIIVPSKSIYILFFTCRYLLTLGILFNRLDIFLIVFAITINIRWLAMYFLYLRHLCGTESKLHTVKFLKELSSRKNNC